MSRIVLRGGTVLDGSGGPAYAADVLVADGRIAEVGPSSRVAIPPQATVVRAAGKTVMPGLWDMISRCCAWGMGRRPDFLSVAGSSDSTPKLIARNPAV